jgi:putative transposase
MQYIRSHHPGGTYFFTVVTKNREPILTNPSCVMLLRESFRKVKQNYPFTLDAFVLMPDHLHCIMTLPENDFDYSTRWALIKSNFSRRFNSANSTLTAQQVVRREKNIWQRRFWEHQITDEKELINHVEYIHYNPVKHGYVESVNEWPYSSFHKFVKLQIYEADWGNDVEINKHVGKE